MASPAKELKALRHLKPNEVVPYTLQEESRILEACDQIGGGKYHLWTRKLMKPRQILWCGEGDLNPHEIAPASTSS